MNMELEWIWIWDLNGHVGSEIEGFEGVHGGFGFGKRNVEGEMILETADALNLAVLNTWFKKKENVHLHENGCPEKVKKKWSGMLRWSR